MKFLLNLRTLKTLCLLLFLNAFFNACEKKTDVFDRLNLPTDVKQLILVTTNSWESSNGTMTLWEKSNNQWIKTDFSINVMVGKNGLGWGIGLHQPVSGIEKNEGDGKAPAGIFEIGDLFGYAEDAPIGTKMNYRQITDRDYFVDDVNSEDYNQWKVISSDKENTPKKIWDSFERMYRKDSLYELGFVVAHNFEPIAMKKGSAIFFHIWRGEGYPTAGCTAMSMDNIENLMKWLDPNKAPLIVQVPENELINLRIAN